MTKTFRSNPSPAPHHELGPSRFPAWSVCPRFEPDPEERADAAEGTAQHAALAGLLSGEEAPFGGFSSDSREAVAWAAEHIRTLAGINPIQCEVRLQYDAPDAFSVSGAATVYHGTADALILRGNLADLTDYKSGGDGRDHRAQLAGYALALFSMRARVKTVRCHVLYGRVRRVDSWALTQADAAAVVLPILQARQDPSRAPMASEYCTFCRDRLTCPALTAHVKTVARANARDDLLPVLREPGSITAPAMMSKALTLARFVSTWSESVRKAASQLAKDGFTLPGYRLQKRRGSREITDIQAVARRIGLPLEVTLAACKLSLPKLIEAYATAKGTTKAQATREVESEMGDLIREGRPSVSLVADRSKQQAGSSYPSGEAKDSAHHDRGRGSHGPE